MADDKKAPGGDKVDEAVLFMNESNDAESANRALALIDLEFRYGKQWPDYAVASRGLDRPQLTINETDSYVRQVTNGQRQQRPRIKVQPVNDKADPKIAKVITGITRHVEVQSDADHAYDTAFDFAAGMGWGYFRIRSDYIDEKSFDQDFYIDTVHNPFCVYFDPHSKLPDGSDAERCLITDMMRKEAFRQDYPDAFCGSFTERGTGDNDPDWLSNTSIRIAEYMFVERKKAKLIKLSNGQILYDDEWKLLEPRMLAESSMTGQQPIIVVGERPSFRRAVKWRKQTAFDILDERDMPFKWIPVVPVYWTRTWIDSKCLMQGMVRPAMDPQRMVNFWQTSITESIALAPKAKWLLAEGADEGHENDYKNANLSPNPVLRYKTTGVDGMPIPPPDRLQPEPPPAGAIEASMMANQNLQRVMGMFDPAIRNTQPQSGKAMNAERMQSENSNFHGYDNLTRSVKHGGRIILSAVPVVLDMQRVQRIIGEDGRDSLVTINEKTLKQTETGQAIETVLNDVRVGTYDVVMDTGPGYDTKRIEGVDSMMQLMNTPIGEKVAQVGDDLIVRQMDFNGSDVLADRLAAANPLSQVDEESDIPPQVQMQLKSMQLKIQQDQQVIQGLQQEIKLKRGIEEMKQAGETQRAHLAATVKAHDTETMAATRQHDVEAKAITAQNVAEINGIVQLLVKHIDTSQLEREIEARNQEQQVKNAEQASSL